MQPMPSVWPILELGGISKVLPIYCVFLILSGAADGYSLGGKWLVADLCYPKASVASRKLGRAGSQVIVLVPSPPPNNALHRTVYSPLVPRSLPPAGDLNVRRRVGPCSGGRDAGGDCTSGDCDCNRLCCIGGGHRRGCNSGRRKHVEGNSLSRAQMTRCLMILRPRSHQQRVRGMGPFRLRLSRAGTIRPEAPMDPRHPTSPPDDDAPNEDDPPPDWTPEQWATFQEHTRGYGDQDENGIDLSLLRENRKRTPTQRLEKLRGFLAGFIGFDRARGRRPTPVPDYDGLFACLLNARSRFVLIVAGAR